MAGLLASLDGWKSAVTNHDAPTTIQMLLGQPSKQSDLGIKVKMMKNVGRHDAVETLPVARRPPDASRDGKEHGSHDQRAPDDDE